MSKCRKWFMDSESELDRFVCGIFPLLLLLAWKPSNTCVWFSTVDSALATWRTTKPNFKSDRLLPDQ